MSELFVAHFFQKRQTFKRNCSNASGNAKHCQNSDKTLEFFTPKRESSSASRKVLFVFWQSQLCQMRELKFSLSFHEQSLKCDLTSRTLQFEVQSLKPKFSKWLWQGLLTIEQLGLPSDDSQSSYVKDSKRFASFSSRWHSVEMVQQYAVTQDTRLRKRFFSA